MVSRIFEAPSLPSQVSGWLQNRDPQAINELMKFCRPMLKAIAEQNLDSVLRSRVDASDMVQDACGDVALSIERIEARNRTQFFAYLRAAIVNKIRDARRRFVFADKRSVLRETHLESSKLSLDDWLVHAQSTPLEQLIHDETCQRVIVAFGKLPRELQRVLRWRFRKGYTNKQIGERVGRSEDDVRMLINRCLARVRRELS